MGRKIVRLVVVAVACGLLTSCMGVTQVARITTFQVADPAAVPFVGGARVYTTQAPFNGTTYRVPSYFVSNTGTPGTVTNALASLPTWVSRHPSRGDIDVWAPTVRFVTGRYLMMFSASRSDGAHCIGAATSTSASGPFNPTTTQWCDVNSTIGYLDPQLHVQGSRVFLLWSRQWAANGGAGGGSEILIQELSSDGLTRTSPIYRLVGFHDVWSQIPTNPGVGPRAYLENPALVRDRYNGYTLVVSIGTWDTTAYHTFQLAFLYWNGTCLADQGGITPLSVNGSTGTGGGSLIGDATSDGNQFFFHAHPAGQVTQRYVYRALTEEFSASGEPGPVTGGPIPGEPPSDPAPEPETSVPGSVVGVHVSR